MINNRFFKTLLLVGIIGTAKIIDSVLKSDSKDGDIIEVEKSNLSEILNDIRSEMNGYLEETPENQKLLRNYIRGRIATINDIENKLKP